MKFRVLVQRINDDGSIKEGFEISREIPKKPVGYSEEDVFAEVFYKAFHEPPIHSLESSLCDFIVTASEMMEGEDSTIGLFRKLAYGMNAWKGNTNLEDILEISINEEAVKENSRDAVTSTPKAPATAPH